MFGRGFSPYGSYGLGAAARSGINWSSLLTNTQKTLGIINQAIPAFYQMRPIFNNMKTMFKVFNAINRDDSKSTKATKESTINTTDADKTKEIHEISNHDAVNQEIYNSDDEGPNFFV